MTSVAGEVADGLLVHPVNTRRSLLELTLPALRAGATGPVAASTSVEVVCVTIVVTGRDEAQMSREPRGGPRAAGVLRHDARLSPGVRAARLRRPASRAPPAGPSRTGGPRWRALIDDELIETVAVVGEPHQIAARIRERLTGISDSVSLVNNRAPDPEHLADVVAGLRSD